MRMRVIANPRHPADQQDPVSITESIIGGLSDPDYDDHVDLTTDHDDGCDCAACLIATGHATDVTADYLTPSGRLRS
jgi:hypothetical protein